MSEPNLDDRALTCRLLDYEEAAEQLGCTPRLVRKLVETRQIASIKVGRLVRLEPRAIQIFIEHNRREPTI